MKHISKKLALAALLPLALSACGGGGGGGTTATTPTPPPVASSTFQDKFGTTFAADFNANSTTATPADPAAGDVPALNLTAEPLDN